MSRLILSLFLWVFWILVSGRADWVTLVVGAVAALVIGFVWGRRLNATMNKALDPRRWFWALLFTFVFIWEMTKANFDVAYRVLHPLRPLSPGIIKVRSGIQSTWGRVFLANAITLTPGTLTVDMQDAELYVHCIRINTDKLDETRIKIVKRFDTFLKKIFD